MTPRVHPTALVDPAARLGNHVEVGPWAIVESCEVGDGSILGPNVTIKAGTILGRDVRVEQGSMIGVPEPNEFPGAIAMNAAGGREIEPAHVHVCDQAIVRSYTTICSGSFLGAACHVMSYVIVGARCRIGERAVIVNAAHLGADVDVGTSAIVSGFVVVAPVTRIGRLAFVGGCSHVRADVPPFTLANGTPALLYGVNRVGLQRAGLQLDDVRDIKRTYQLLFRETLDPRSAVVRARAECQLVAGAPARELLDFVEAGTAPIATARAAMRSRGREAAMER